jgi:DNA polymerase-3 subunit chi
MPQVYFFELIKPGTKAAAIAEYAERLHHKGHRVLIRVSNEVRAEQLNRYLWGFRAESFLPHSLLPCDPSDLAVLISHEERREYTSLADSLIASALCSMEFMQAFGQVLDFVESYDSKKKEESRRRFRDWQDLGVNPRFIKAA